MCGRVRILTDFSEIRIAFPIPPELPAPNLAPNWERGADRSAARRAVRRQGRTATVEMMSCGLVPFVAPMPPNRSCTATWYI
jgi:hypothetical protein